MNMQIDKKQTAQDNRVFLDKVRRHSMARHKARLVLEAMIGRVKGEIFQPLVTVTVTKSNLCGDTCLCIKSVKAALKFLREEGSIVATQGIEGGRCTAVTYCFRVVGQGASEQIDTAGQAPDVGAIWGQALKSLRASHRNNTLAWYANLRLLSVTATDAHLDAPTAFAANSVQGKLDLSGPVCAALGVKRIRVTIR